MNTSTHESGAAARTGPPPVKPEPEICQACGQAVEPLLLEHWPGEPQGHWLAPDLCPSCAEAQAARHHPGQRETQAARRWRTSGLPLAARDWSFDLALERAQALKRDPADFARWHAAFRACRYWHAARGTLYLFGPEGSGKTVLSWCLAHQALESDGPAPLWLSLPELFDLVADSYRAGSPARELESRAKTAGLLLLDEVGGPGADRPRKAERDCFFKLVNHRADHKLPTVITTNLPPADLAKVFKDPFDRTIARLIKADGVLVEGKSFRLIEAEGRW